MTAARRGRTYRSECWPQERFGFGTSILGHTVILGPCKKLKSVALRYGSGNSKEGLVGVIAIGLMVLLIFILLADEFT
jgi:hypothetical protein